MYPRTTKSFLLLIVLLIVAIALAGCDLGGSPTAPIADPRSPLPMGTPTPFAYNIRDDVQFIDTMVPHHQLAIDMARIAENRYQHGEVLGLAHDIITDQEDEIHRMLLWRAELAGASPTPDPRTPMSNHDIMPGMDVDLAALATSKDFDRDFINAMTQHHQAAIDMSNAAVPNLKKREVRDLAHDIIIVQQVEIDRMKRWLKDWYK